MAPNGGTAPRRSPGAPPAPVPEQTAPAPEAATPQMQARKLRRCRKLAKDSLCGNPIGIPLTNCGASRRIYGWPLFPAVITGFYDSVGNVIGGVPDSIQRRAARSGVTADSLRE
jgi:hypothetical protein